MPSLAHNTMTRKNWKIARTPTDRTISLAILAGTKVQLRIYRALMAGFLDWRTNSKGFRLISSEIVLKET